MKKEDTHSLQSPFSRKIIILLLLVVALAYMAPIKEKTGQVTGEAVRYITEDVVMQGFLDRIHGEKLDSTGNPQNLEWYYLETPEGKHFALQGSTPYGVGNYIAVEGVKISDREGKQLVEMSPMGLIDGIIRVKNIQIIDPTPTKIKTNQLKRPERITGNAVSTAKSKDLRVAIILFNFLNNQNQPFTVSQVNDAIFAKNGTTAATGSLRHYYEEASLGKIKMTGQIYGWYTIPYTNSPCVSSLWTLSARQAAVAQGFDAHKYDMFVYIFASAPNCTASGFGSDTTQGAYLNNVLNTGIISHEFGHALGIGLAHANSLTCTNSTGAKVTMNPSWMQGCTNTEYGDLFDVMGSTSWTNIYHFNTHFKNRHAFMDLQNTVTVTQNGIYNIKPLENTTNSAQTLKILREIDQRNTSKFYYLDFRRPYGYDNFVANSSVTTGVSIRLASDMYNDNYLEDWATYILDTTPSTSTFSDAPLAVGKIFNDTFKGISIKTLNASSSGASVQITVPNPPVTCVRSNPGIIVSPQGDYGVRGETLTFGVKVKNLDAAPCGSSTFTIAGFMSSTMSTPVPTFQITLSPGETREQNVQITSLPAAVSGNYYINTYQAQNMAVPLYKSSSYAAYNVI